MVFGSVCSGIEAASVAWHPLGWRSAFVSEIEKFPCAVLAHHYPSVPNHGDMTKFKEWPYATLDLLVGGTPCQSFSVAGLRKGLDDPRGKLTLTYLAVAERYKPRWVVWENVPGVLSDGTGAFGAFLGGLAKLGYGFAYRILDAQYFGVPQRRRRVFVVGCLGDWRAAAAVLLERASLSGNPAPRREAGQRTAASLVSGAAGSGGIGYDNQALFSQNGDNLIRSADLVERELSRALRGEGFDATEDGTGRGTPLVPVGADCFNGDLTGDVAATLGTRGSSQNASGPTVLAFTQNQRDEVRNLDDLAGSLAGEPGMKQQTYIAFSAKDHGGDAGETAPTLRAGGHTAVAFCNTAGDTALGLSKPGVPPLTSRHGDPGNVLLGMQVRRLTPRECERLQGFPDDYTLIPYNGKPAKDGPRYKALGNSMAVPVMRWIGSRIQMVEWIRGIHELEKHDERVGSCLSLIIIRKGEAPARAGACPWPYDSAR